MDSNVVIPEKILGLHLKDSYFTPDHVKENLRITPILWTFQETPNIFNIVVYLTALGNKLNYKLDRVAVSDHLIVTPPLILINNYYVTPCQPHQSGCINKFRRSMNR